MTKMNIDIAIDVMKKPFDYYPSERHQAYDYIVTAMADLKIISNALCLITEHECYNYGEDEAVKKAQFYIMN